MQFFGKTYNKLILKYFIFPCLLTPIATPAMSQRFFALASADGDVILRGTAQKLAERVAARSLIPPAPAANPSLP